MLKLLPIVVPIEAETDHPVVAVTLPIMTLAWTLAEVFTVSVTVPVTDAVNVAVALYGVPL